MKKPSSPAAGDVVGLIQDAVNRGQVVLVLPAPDQPSSRPPIDRALTAPPLRTDSSLVAVCCQAFGLSLAQSRVFVTLLKYDHATRANLHAALSPNGDSATKSNGVGVTIHFLRKKLANHDIEILNTYGLGYRLAVGARDRTRKLLAAFGEDIIAAATPPATPSD